MIKNVVSEVEKAPKRWLNNIEAEKYLGCKERFLRNLRSTGQLRFYVTVYDDDGNETEDVVGIDEDDVVEYIYKEIID